MTKIIRQITLSMSALMVLALLSACGASGTGAPAGSGSAAPTSGTPAGSGNSGPAPVTGGAPAGGASGDAQLDSVQGQVSQVEGQKLVIKNEAGSTVTVQLNDNTKVQNHERGAAADIKTGTDLSVIALEQNGTLQAIELQIGGDARQLPVGGPVPLTGDQPMPGMGGPAADAPAGLPEPKALHGTVEKLDGSTLTLKTDDGKSTSITLAAQTMIQKVSQGSVADVKPGTHVIAAGKRNGSSFEVAQLSLMNIQMP